MDKEELRRVLELINQAYEEAGRKITTAVLSGLEEDELVIDNREEEEIN